MATLRDYFSVFPHQDVHTEEYLTRERERERERENNVPKNKRVFNYLTREREETAANIVPTQVPQLIGSDEPAVLEVIPLCSGYH